jgi:hypothetical protein
VTGRFDRRQEKGNPMSDAAKTPLSLRDVVDLEAWLDESFRDDLMQNPGGAVARVAEKYGIEVPAGMNFSVVSDTETQYNLILSVNPAGEAPAASASEVRAYGMDLGLPSGGGDPEPARRGSSYTLFCNPAICAVASRYPQT